MEFEDLTWSTRSFTEHMAKLACAVAAPFVGRQWPGAVGLLQSSTGAAESRCWCSFAATNSFYPHWRRHWEYFFDHIWIICCLRGFIVQHLFVWFFVFFFFLNPATVICIFFPSFVVFSDPFHTVVTWRAKACREPHTATWLFCAAKPLEVKCLKSKTVNIKLLAEWQKCCADCLLDVWLLVKCQVVFILTCNSPDSNTCIRTLLLIRYL